MSRIRVRCQLADGVWARIDALQLTPGGECASQAERRERAVTLLVMSGLEAAEAARDAANPPPAEAPTPRNDVPAWLARTPSTDDPASPATHPPPPFEEPP